MRLSSIAVIASVLMSGCFSKGGGGSSTTNPTTGGDGGGGGVTTPAGATGKWVGGAPEAGSVPVTFSATLPANTPAGTIDLVILSFYEYGDHKRIAMSRPTSTSVTATADLPAGGMIRYRYERGDRDHREKFDADINVAHREILVGSAATSATDVVARWQDLAASPALLTGTVSGTVTGTGSAPLVDATVSIGGVHAATAADGTYKLEGVPVGSQRLTVTTALGEHRASSAVVTVASSATATQNFSLLPAAKISVKLTVTPSADLPANGRIHAMGNNFQLGATAWYLNGLQSQQGLVVKPFTPAAGGKVTRTVELYEGSYVEFAYTFGTELINQERHENGSSLVRWFVVSAATTEYADTITRFKPDGFNAVKINATTPAAIPVTQLQLAFPGGGAFFPAFPVSANSWTYTFFLNPSDTSLSYNFRHDNVPETRVGGDRSVAISGNTEVSDTITGFTYVDAASNIPSYSFTPAAVTARAGFMGGVFPLDYWTSDFMPLTTSTLAHLDTAAPNAKWYVMSQIFDMESLDPPVINRRSPRAGSVGMPEEEFNAVADLVHASGRKIYLFCTSNPESIPGWGTTVTIGDFFGPHDHAWYVKYMAEMSKLYLHVAKAAARKNIEMVQLNQTDLFAFSDPGTKAVFNQWMIDTIIQMRAIAPGVKFAAERYGTDAAWTWYSQADFISFKIWNNLGVSDPTSVSEIKTKFDALFDGDIAALRTASGNIPVVISQVAYPSVAGSPNQPAHIDHIFPDSVGVVYDAVAQARVYDALMQSVAERAWVRGIFPFGYAYGGHNASKNMSVRGKPAENLLNAYFGLLNQ